MAQIARGVPRVGWLRHSLEVADAAAESPMESRLGLLLVLNGLPKPQLQVPLHDDSGFFVARPDLYYPTARLAIDCDGAAHRSSHAADNRRQNRLLEPAIVCSGLPRVTFCTRRPG